MPVTVRLDPGTERKLDQLARRTRQTRSDVVREAIERYAADQVHATVDQSANAAWADVIGIMSSDAGDAAGRTTGERFAAAVRKKAQDRRAR